MFLLLTAAMSAAMLLEILLVKSVFSRLTESLNKTLLGTLSETTVVVKTRPMANFSLIHGRHVGAPPKDSNMISPTLPRMICE